MVDYYSVRVDLEPNDENLSDLLAAFLAEIDYESFLPDERGLTAYVKTSDFNEDKLKDILDNFPVKINYSYSTAFVKGEDWNYEWEKNYFQPIVIEDRCVVHSSFHKDVPKAEYDIIIDPKMAFGTGHHSTTNLIISYLLDMDLKNLNVVDMGTGTAILAILCKLRGCSSVTGIEIDPGAYENAVENSHLNNVDINLICGDASALAGIESCDLLLANINRNIILADIDKYVRVLKPGSSIILSGFYKEDIDIILKKAALFNLRLQEVREDNNWVAIRLIF